MADALRGARILMLPRYTMRGPSSRVRMGAFVPMLEAAGASVRVEPFFGDAYLDAYFARGDKPLSRALAGYARRARILATARADLAWVEKELFPFLPAVTERALALRGLRYVVDYDDAVFHGYDRHPRALVRRVLGAKFDPLLRGAAAVTAGNPYLAAYARTHGARRVVQVPTVVDPARYPVMPPPGGERLRIGWIGTPANARYLAPVIAALRMLGDRVPATLVTVGAHALPDMPVPQEVHAWSEEREGALMAGIDIGVMPLVDSDFERGKCGYKLIQYMAAGRPVIASPVGVNSDIVTPEVGMLVASVEDWAAAIARMADDAALRARMGAAARARVEADYSVDSAGRTLMALFREVLA